MNKTVWTYWAQGWDKAPYVSKKCVNSWIKHNPDWTVYKLDDGNLPIVLPEFSATFSSHKLNKTALSDILRIFILKYKGGVWVDSTLFCMKPLDDWLTDDLFLFTRTDTTNIMNCSWFIKGDSNSKIINLWYDNVVNMWKNRPDINHPTDYFWFHHLFSKLYKDNLEFKSEWDKTTTIGANVDTKQGPHYLTPYSSTINNQVTQADIERFDSKIDPCYKLTRHVSINDGSTMNYLIKNY